MHDIFIRSNLSKCTKLDLFYCIAEETLSRIELQTWSPFSWPVLSGIKKKLRIKKLFYHEMYTLQLELDYRWRSWVDLWTSQILFVFSFSSHHCIIIFITQHTFLFILHVTIYFAFRSSICVIDSPKYIKCKNSIECSLSDRHTETCAWKYLNKSIITVWEFHLLCACEYFYKYCTFLTWIVDIFLHAFF